MTALEDNDEGRPPAKEAASNVTAGDFHIVAPMASNAADPRCLLCGHVITSELSIRIGVGRDCRRRIHRLGQAVA